MTQSRFISLAILHCHKEGTENSNLAAVANEFVSKQVNKNQPLEDPPQITLLNCELMNSQI